MALPKSKDMPVGGVDPRLKLIGAAAVIWSANWGFYKATGFPLPYCFAKDKFGPFLSDWYDGLRAILFVAVIIGLFTLQLRWSLTLVGVMVLNLMVPGIVATLFSFGHSCAPPKPAPVAVAEKVQPAPRPVQPKAKAKPKNCNTNKALPDLPGEECIDLGGFR